MEKLIVKNGIVFDPLNEISGEKKDLLVENGKFVESFSNQDKAKEIDASGKTIIPAGVDIHSHIASQQVNWARLLGSKNKKFIKYWNRITLKSIAEEYIKNGYTYVIDANVYPSLSKQTILDFSNLPVLDKGMLLNVSNLWALEDEFQKGKIVDMGYFLIDLLSACKGFGIKSYNPFEAETWNFKKLRKNIEQGGKLYNFSSLDVYENLTKAVENLNLPHSNHAHIEGYENDVASDNLRIIIEKIDFSNIKEGTNPYGRDQVLHLAHANSYNMDGNNSELTDALNSGSELDIDLGFIGFDEINPLITSDRHLINSHMKNKENEIKVIRTANETEGDAFVSLRQFDKNNKDHCVLWANAIDLALQAENKWQIQLSFNFPHYSHVRNLPKIAGWLMNTDIRSSFMEDMNNEFLNQTSLKEKDDVLTFEEFIIISRASPAKSLGISDIKGSFSPGNDGDINILNIDINEIDISKNYEVLEQSLENLEYVIKAGKIIKKNDKLNLETNGKIFWTEGNTDIDKRDKFMEKKKVFYQKYYSTFYDTLRNEINDAYLRKI